MPYTIKEIYYTLQGEGAWTGRPAVFLRFAGCNLWTGREQDRATAVCSFCDTEFVGTDGPGGGRFATPADLAAQVASYWPSSQVVDRARAEEGRRYVVCTGGEPLLQLDGPAVVALHAHGFEVAIETNGTQPLPAPLPDDPGVDWVCLSPKAGAPVVLDRCDELKLVYPQPALLPAAFAAFAAFPARHHFLQPMDVPGDSAQSAANRDAAVSYCLAHPRWRLSLQTHKTLGIA